MSLKTRRTTSATSIRFFLTPVYTSHSLRRTALGLVTVATLTAPLAGCSQGGVDADPGVVAWTFDTGAEVWSSPALAGTQVFVGSDSGTLHALDLLTGEELWAVHTDGPVRARPAVDAGIVYVTSDDGSLYAVEAESGEQVWTTDVGTERSGRDDFTYQGSSPTAADGRVFVGGADGTVRAVDAKSGKVAWEFETEGPIRTAPAVVDDVVYLGSDDGNLYALDAATGDPTWAELAGGEITTSPTVADGAVYVGTRAAQLKAFSAADGTLLWSSGWDASWVESSPAVVGDTAYVGSSDIHELRAVNVADGTVRWVADLGGWPWSSPAVNDGVVYQGSLYRTQKDGGDLSFHAVDAETGDVRWSVGTGPSLEYAPGGEQTAGVVSSPVVSHGAVVFGALDGLVYAVGL